MFFKENNVDPQELRYLIIPKSEYEQLVEEWSALRKYEEVVE